MQVSDVFASHYRSLEDRFRGSPELIRQRVSSYLSLIAQVDVNLPNGRQALDLGSGRGEWLALIAENGWEVTGVDSNPGMVNAARLIGVSTITADVLEFLRACEDEAFGLITAFHLVEHLPFDVLMEMLSEIRRVLIPGGLVILETPNPENLTVTSWSFYMDPTHQRPLPPHLLQFLAEQSGLASAGIVRLNGRNVGSELGVVSAIITALFLSANDYAILATKSAGEAKLPEAAAIEEFIRHTSQHSPADIGSLLQLADEGDRRAEQAAAELSELRSRAGATEARYEALHASADRQIAELLARAEAADRIAWDRAHRMAAAEARFAALHASATAQYGGLAAAHHETREMIVAAEARFAALHASATAQYGGLAAAHHETREMIVAAEAQLAELSGKAEDASHQLRAIYDSRSWRLTAPFRRLSAWARRLMRSQSASLTFQPVSGPRPVTAGFLSRLTRRTGSPDSAPMDEAPIHADAQAGATDLVQEAPALTTDPGPEVHVGLPHSGNGAACDRLSAAPEAPLSTREQGRGTQHLTERPLEPSTASGEPQGESDGATAGHIARYIEGRDAHEDSDTVGALEEPSVNPVGMPVLLPETIDDTPSVRLVFSRLKRAVEHVRRGPFPPSPTLGPRERLAYVSPLPPERSGIADFGAELLPALAVHYEIDVVIAPGSRVEHEWIEENCRILDARCFTQVANNYDRIVYHMGNSHFHVYMLDLIEKFPGIVVLHDFFLGHCLAYSENTSPEQGRWSQALYTSHGYKALMDRHIGGNGVSPLFDYPANFSILYNAQKVIVHSKYSCGLAEKFYGHKIAENWAVLPLARTPADQGSRHEARERCSIAEDDFVICSFGMQGETKLVHRILDAWFTSPLADEPSCHLVFVGEFNESDYCRALLQRIAASHSAARIRITGFVPPDTYKDFLRAADIAVQLRTSSRGETSAAVLDCMAYAVPTIVNANGAMAELPVGSVEMLPDDFSDAQLRDAMQSLWEDRTRGERLGQKGYAAVRDYHAPAVVAQSYCEAIESSAARAPTAWNSRALADYARRNDAIAAETDYWLTHARRLAQEVGPARPARQLLVDVSALVREDLKTGIQRVVRAQLIALVLNPPRGFRIEPVWLSAENGEWRYRYARRYAGQLLGGRTFLDDELVEVGLGDIFIGADYFPPGVVPAAGCGLYNAWREQGVDINFIVYDVLPLTIPEFFPPVSEGIHATWLSAIAGIADRLICISGAAADGVRTWLAANNIRTSADLQIVTSPLGADINSSAPSGGLPVQAASELNTISQRPSFLMVGTVEPRKGHLQTIAAFDLLWREGIDVNLVIVGAEGWKGVPHGDRRTLPAIVTVLRSHSELGKRLIWLESVSDEYLVHVYGACTCLLAASEGEGFGLPVIEAARHKLPILARDIPVFREVAGSHASYFGGKAAADLALAIRTWLDDFAQGCHTRSTGLPWVTWAESIERLKATIMHPRVPEAEGTRAEPSG